MRRLVAATALVAVIAYIAVYSRADGDPPIHSDGYSYYVYLPATLIYKDASLEALAREWYGGTYPEFTGIRRWPPGNPSGRWLNPHPIGVAVLMTPFFVAADALSWWSNLPRDGFSLYYQHGAALAGLAYFLAGLALLHRILSRHFGSGIVLATLVCITWGTNLFHYGVFDGTFSHAFSFFLICTWLFAVERWWEAPTVFRSLPLGAIAALIVSTRHTNAIFVLVLPLYGIARASDLRARVGELWRRRQLLLVAALAGVIGVIPQLALYRWTTGSWLASPYGALDVGFAWRCSSGRRCCCSPFSAPSCLSLLRGRLPPGQTTGRADSCSRRRSCSPSKRISSRAGRTGSSAPATGTVRSPTDWDSRRHSWRGVSSGPPRVRSRRESSRSSRPAPCCCRSSR